MKTLAKNLTLAVFFWLSVLFAGCCINVGELFRAKYRTTEHLSVPIEGVTDLDVQTHIGSITVTGSNVTDCNIVAEITVKAATRDNARKLAEQVKIELAASDNKLAVTTRKPDSLSDKRLTVNLKVTVPAVMNLTCEAHIGTIKVSDIRGRILASTNVGSIICSKVFSNLALTANVGSIEVNCDDDAPPVCNAEIITNVGSINFVGPSHLSAKVNASTNVGSIKTRRPMTITGDLKKSITGTIGVGEGQISLKTNVGSIEIE